MAGFFQRLFKIGQSEAHAVLDNMEDPIRMTEQGIRDLKTDLQASMTSLGRGQECGYSSEKGWG